MILGAAYGWSDRKGFDIFIELAERLDKKYRICLVGTDDAADRVIPDNVISIHVTSDQHELAGIYSAADVFVNPTREEVFGMVNVEALACGTPVITFDTGGSVECVDKESGAVVKKDGSRDAVMKELIAQIKRACQTNMYSERNCVCRGSVFFQENMCRKYLDVYRKMFT